VRDDDSAVWWLYGFVVGLVSNDDDPAWVVCRLGEAADKTTARINNVRAADDIDDAIYVQRMANQP
jgi:hypothetical protein